MMTYSRLLDGVPDAKTNDRFIESAIQRAEQHCFLGNKPALIPPPRRDYLREPGDMEILRSQRERHRRRNPEWLPRVGCVGTFRSYATAHGDQSALVVVWFQDEYAPPIQEPALGWLLSLDWDSLATDFDF
jgi:hypothetical protein